MVNWGTAGSGQEDLDQKIFIFPLKLYFIFMHNGGTIYLSHKAFDELLHM